jgi:hypothetical protein
MAHGNVGNQNAVGNRGGGRKTAIQERRDVEFFKAIWNGEFSEAKLKRIIRSGKHGSKHIFAAKCMSGNARALNKLVDKLYPNRARTNMASGKPEPLARPSLKEKEEISQVIKVIFQ